MVAVLGLSIFIAVLVGVYALLAWVFGPDEQHADARRRHAHPAVEPRWWPW